MNTNTGIDYVAVLLAIATFALAWQTWRMAQVARRSLALDERPYLAFEGIDALSGTPGNPELTPVIKLKNVGRVLIHFRVETADVRANGLVPPNPTLTDTEGVVFPGLQAEYSCPVMAGIDVNKDFTGHVHFRITYWSDPRGDKYIAEEDLDFRGNASAGWARWNRTKSPNYT